MKDLDFNHLVEEYYQPLYRFAMSLARNQDEACDLTQQTFALWAAKGYQLRDKTKVKTWLFTTLYREFIGTRRRQKRYPHEELTETHYEETQLHPSVVDSLDSQLALEALAQTEERYRAPLTLFYLQQHSYQEIAEILDIPIGTVMSRLSRGKEKLRQALQTATLDRQNKIVSIDTPEGKKNHG